MALADLTYYCTREDVERVYGAVGVRLHADDDGDNVVSADEEENITFARGDATETVNFHLFSRYTPAWLATSRWVNVRAAWLAAYALGDRRGNPAPDSIAERCERFLEELDLVAQGSRMVPNLPLRMSLAPAFSNVRADPRHQFRVLRVERRHSTNRQSQLPRNPDYRSEFLWEL